MGIQSDFKAYGHENVLSQHRNTVEFTSDSHLTKRGDCILAVSAEIIPKAMTGKLEISVTVDGHRERFVAYGNPDFCDEHEMVIRKTDFVDDRTFAIKSGKAACDIDREIVRALQNPKAVAHVSIRQVD